MNNKDGGLYFGAEIDMTKWREDLNKMRGDILGIEKSANAADIDFGINRENLAIQKQVIEEIKKNISEIEKRADKMYPGKERATVLGELGPLKNELAAEEEALKVLQSSLDATKAKYNSLTTERNRALDVMRRLTLENKQGTDEYKKAEQSVIDYNTAITQANEKAKLLSAGGLAGMIQKLGLATSVLATGQSVIGVFAGENENLNKIMLKSQALLSATISLQQLHTAVVSKGALGVNSLAGAKAALTAANTRLAVSLGISNLAATALMATLTLGLSVVITGIIIALNKLNEKHKENIEINKKVAESLAEPLVAYKKLQAQWNALGGDLDAKKKFITDNADEFEDLGVQVDNVRDAENLLSSQTAAFENAMIARAKAAAYAQVAVEDFKKALDAQNEVDDFNAQWKDAGFFGSIGLGAKAIFTNLDDKKAGKLTKRGEENIKKQIIEEEKAKDLLRAAGIKEYERSRPTNRPRNSRTPSSVANEYFPPGSVAEITKRLSEIDKALSLSNDVAVSEQLKTKRIATQKELTEALKKIRTQSFEEEINEMKRQIDQRDNLLRSGGYSKDEVDAIFPEIKDLSFIDYLTNLNKELGKVDGKEAAADLLTLQKIVSDYTGAETFIENVNNQINELKSNLSGADLIEKLEQFRNASLAGTTGDETNAKNQAIDRAVEEELTRQKANYKRFLEEHQSYEERRIEITKRYAELRALAESDVALKKIDDSEAKEQSDLFLEELQNSDAWLKMFSNMEAVAVAELYKFRNILITKLKEAKTEAEKIKIGEFIGQIDAEIKNRNPFGALADSFGDLINGIKDGTATAEQFIMALKDLDGVQDEVNKLIDSFQGMTDALGLNVDMSGIKEAFNNITDGISGIGQAVGGFMSGNPLEMLKGVMKAVTAIGKLFNKDAKKEREIQKQASAIKKLEESYTALAFAAERAFGAQKYDGQKELIKNLENQKRLIQTQMQLEQSKKKADKQKIDGYKEALAGIDRNIIELQEGIVENVLQTDIPDMAAKMGDALVEAFGRGKDSVDAIGVAFDDMMGNIMRNQLNKSLETQMAGLYEKAAKFAGFNTDGTGAFDGFTDEELAELKNDWLNISENGKALAEVISEMTGQTQEQAQGLKGDIKGVTEKTAGALEGQINAMRVNQIEGLNAMRQSLMHLSKIADNTDKLHSIDRNISELNSKTKNTLAGI